MLNIYCIDLQLLLTALVPECTLFQGDVLATDIPSFIMEHFYIPGGK